MRLDSLVDYLDGYLRIRAIADSEYAMNGLQVANSGEVHRLATAVDVCAATIRSAGTRMGTLLIVHHGLFWGGPAPIVGPARDRMAALLAGDVALYAAHLPLDLHPDVGNNALLARGLELRVAGPFGDAHGQPIGVWGELALTRDQLEQRLAHVLGRPPRLLPFGPAETRRIGIVSGAAGSMIAEAARAGLDTFITGEGSHHTFFDAEELGLNVFYGGHYATETFGVRALGEHLSAKFGLPAEFIDHPTGL
ncbi:MAG TPA: Nif3-like dinuclear metal center hexameric protein [Gemmatimonadales bacterium]|nr:Nif3-like dinuclear metal center hexameric protein [Gemmatimonadales bacterium]